jgi:flagellar biosynthetic protein FliO
VTVQEAPSSIDALKQAESLPLETVVQAPRTVKPIGGGSDSMIWTVVWSIVVIALLAAVLLLMRRFLRNSRFVAGGGALRVLARHGLDTHSRLYLVEVGETLFLVGGTREQLNPLGTIRDPEEVARVRELAGGGERKVFQERLAEEVKASERGENAQKVHDHIGQIRDTIKGWGNKTA